MHSSLLLQPLTTIKENYNYVNYVFCLPFGLIVDEFHCLSTYALKSPPQFSTSFLISVQEIVARIRPLHIYIEILMSLILKQVQKRQGDFFCISLPEA